MPTFISTEKTLAIDWTSKPLKKTPFCILQGQTDC